MQHLFSRGHFPTRLFDLFGFITGLLNIFISLEVLCLDVKTDIYGFDSYYQPSLLEFIRVERDFDPNILLSDIYLEPFQKDQNLKVLVVGKTAFMKKSTSPAVLREMDRLHSEYGWNLRENVSNYLPLELLTEPRANEITVF